MSEDDSFLGLALCETVLKLSQHHSSPPFTKSPHDRSVTRLWYSIRFFLRQNFQQKLLKFLAAIWAILTSTTFKVKTTAACIRAVFG